MKFLWLVWLILAAQVEYLHAQDFPYKGKTVRVIIGFPSGGGADAEGRVLARHLGKHIPGNPTLIAHNMPRLCKACARLLENWNVIRNSSRS